MKREIQVHFENCGQIIWHEEIEDVESWLREVMSENKIIAYDVNTGRHFGFDTKTVTAFIVSHEKHPETDLWRRTYAACQGNIEENDQQKHPGNGRIGPSPEAGRSSCY